MRVNPFPAIVVSYLVAALPALVGPASARASIVVSASDDAMITRASWDGGQGSNHGSRTDMSATRGGSSAFHRWPLVKFDLSAYAGLTVKDGTTPTVDLWFSHLLSAVAGNPVRVHLITGHDWDESTVTYNNYVAGQSSTLLNNGRTLYQSQGGQYLPWNIPASVVQGWLDAPSTNYGLIFDSNTTVNNVDAWFHTKEYGTGEHAPLLTFESESGAIPEPTTLIIWSLLGGLGAGWWRRRKRA